MMKNRNIQANYISRDETKDLVTLDQHFEDALRHARAQFESTGLVIPHFKCVTEGETFHVCASWSNCDEKDAAYPALRDSFRRRGVNRYVFTCETCIGRNPDVLPADDPECGEYVQVIANECNGSRKYAQAEIMRNGKTPTLGPWEESDDVQGWLFELLEEGYSDRAPVENQPLATQLSADEFEDLLDQHPKKAGQLQDSFEIHTKLGDLIADQVQKHLNDDPTIILMALESVLCSIVKEMRSLTGVGVFARFLRDHPDKFPMFPTVPSQSPSAHQLSLYTAALRRFSSEQRKAGHSLSTIFAAFINKYMYVGSQAIGALKLADRIEDWSPEHQAKLREVGLRSSFELDHEEGNLFLALSADSIP
jgi:hypothetical protein